MRRSASVSRWLLSCVAALLWCVVAPAQDFANLSLSAYEVETVGLLGRLSGLSMVDGKLVAHAHGMMFSASSHVGNTPVLEVDRDLYALDPEMTYVVKHPVSVDIYYTKVSSRGESHLYCFSTSGRKAKVERVRPGKYRGSIEHPTFSENGELMVFASSKLDGMGGSDLWYCILDEGEWSAPRNLGPRINSAADERAPHLAGPFLYFSSNRRVGQPNDTAADFDLYASRLVSERKVYGDTIFQIPIGQCTSMNLGEPLSSLASDDEMVYDAQRQMGYWLTSLPETPETSQLFMFHGRLDCEVLVGTIRSNLDNKPSPFAHVNVFDASGNDSSSLYVSTSDALGRFRVFLPAGRTYRLVFSQHNCFPFEMHHTVGAKSGDDLYREVKQDVTLQAVAIDMYRYFANADEKEALFGAPLSADLSTHGMEVLDQLSLFLTANPRSHLTIDLVFAEETDFANALFSARKAAMMHHWTTHGATQELLQRVRFEQTTVAVGEHDNAVGISFSD